MHNNDQNQLIQQIYKYLNDNFSQPIGLTNVSEHVNRNPSYISRFIKQATGRKFSEILAECLFDSEKNKCNPYISFFLLTDIEAAFAFTFICM